MKTMKKFFALLLAVIMLMAMGTTAFAAEPGTGSITINNATIGESYAGYKIFDATVAEDNIAYTIENNNQFYNKISASDSPFSLTQIGDTDTFTVAVKEGKSDQDVLDFVKTLVAGATPDLASQTATGTQVSWDNVPYGYYFITSSLGTTVSVTNADSDVTIVDKNLKPGWNGPGDGQLGKNVSDREDGFYSGENTASQGDTIYYRIYAFMPKYNANKIVHTYTITDIPGNGIKLDLESITITVNDTPLTPSDYLLTPNSSTGGFSIQIMAFTETHPENANVIIQFSAEVTGDIYYYDRTNTATITWTELEPSTDDPTVPENPSSPTETTDAPDESITHTYVYGFDLQKYKNEAREGNELDGAKFRLYNTSTGGNEILLIKTEDGYVVPDSAQKAANPTYVDIEAGFAEIRGLKEGTYYLEEVKAPAGYNPLTERLAVTVGKAVDQNFDGIDDDTVKIINNTGVLLPETGGIGTTIFYVVGGLLMAGAVVLLITRKKMSANND